MRISHESFRALAATRQDAKLRTALQPFTHRICRITVRIKPSHIFFTGLHEIDERRPLGSTIHIEPPRYLGVSVMARIAVAPGASKERVVADADRAVADFLHPVSGGYDGKGWPFGRQVVLGDIHGVLGHVPGLLYVDLLRLVAVDAVTGARGEPGDRVVPGKFDLLFNVSNDIEVLES